MSQAELFALLTLAAVGTFTPGPNTALSATLAANHGLRGALPFVCAVTAGWGILLVLNAVGLGAVVLGLPPLRWGLLLMGALYLLWLAYQLASSQRLSEAAALFTLDLSKAFFCSLSTSKPGCWPCLLSVGGSLGMTTQGKDSSKPCLFLWALGLSATSPMPGWARVFGTGFAARTTQHKDCKGSTGSWHWPW